MANTSLKKRIPTNNDFRPFLNIPWTSQQEADYERWLAEQSGDSAPDRFIGELLRAGVGIKLAAYEASWVCTLDSPTRKEAEQPYLLSAWSDNWVDALRLAHYKLFELLKGDWNHPFAARSSSQRR